MNWRVGVDIGGAFIDFCARDERTGRPRDHDAPHFVKSKLFAFLPRATSLAGAMTALRQAYPEGPAR